MMRFKVIATYKVLSSITLAYTGEKTYSYVERSAEFETYEKAKSHRFYRKIKHQQSMGCEDEGDLISVEIFETKSIKKITFNV